MVSPAVLSPSHPGIKNNSCMHETKLCYKTEIEYWTEKLTKRFYVWDEGSVEQKTLIILSFSYSLTKKNKQALNSKDFMVIRK